MQQSPAPALEAVAASIEMRQLPGLEAALAKMAEQVSLNLPTQDLLASFGEEWTATLTKAFAAAGADLPPARTAVEAARRVEVQGTHGRAQPYATAKAVEDATPDLERRLRGIMTP